MVATSTSLILALATLLTRTVALPRPANVVRRQYDVWTPTWTQPVIPPPPPVTDQNTLNSTVIPPPDSTRVFPAAVAGGQLPISIVNNAQTNASLNAYMTALDVNGRLVMLQPDGQFFYPVGGSSVPEPINGSVMIPLGGQGSTTTVTVPGWVSAARLWISEGNLQFFVVENQGIWSLVEPSIVARNDPNLNINFGFTEMTNDKTLGLFVNLSFVDFIGLALGISVTSRASTTATTTDTATDANSGQTTQSVAGLPPTSASQICADLTAQAAIDGQPWDKLCVCNPSTGALLRVLSPADYISINPGAFEDYWTSYISKVWETYSTQPLIINTQSSSGNVTCTVSNNQLSCANDSRSYAQPTAQDIFTCNTGPFAIQESDNDVHRAVVPRLCAAINRSTLLLPEGNMQPSLTESSYYTTSPTNYYSKFIHQYEIGGLGYAFSYDDVAPTYAADQSGLIWSTNPLGLTVTVQGGPS